METFILILKLILITAFIFFSSKSFGLIINQKIKLKDENYIGIGYLFNIALFFIIQLPVMLFKLSSTWLMVFGILYLIICCLAIIYTVMKKQLFKFNKKEIIALIITLIVMVIYCLMIDFGYIESYDSYFYSVLSNSAQNTDHISIYDPYTGLSNLQNFYKYISFYYMPSVLANVLGISSTYLVLIWSFAFMNLLLLMITAFTTAQISKKKYINYILSILVLTFLLSIFRSPFNILHILTMVVPIYLFKYILEYIKTKEVKTIFLMVMILIASIAMSSTTLFVGLAFIYVFFVVISFLHKEYNFKHLFICAIPIFFLIILYMFESLNSSGILLSGIAILIALYALFHSKVFNKIFLYFGRICIIIVPLFFIILPHLDISFLNTIFVQNDALNSLETTESTNTKTCLENEQLKMANDYYKSFDRSKHSSSMEYIYQNNDPLYSKLLINITHSLLKYGGILFFFIYCLIKKRKDPLFLSLIVYLIAFNNPLVSNGMNILAKDLGLRIVLFFNTIYALYGIKMFFEFIEEKISKTKYQKFYLNHISKLVILYGFLFVASFTTYNTLFRIKDYQEYDLIYKIPQKQIAVEKIINEEIENNKTKKKARIFYTASNFNISLVDTNPNNKIKAINSKEYMNYFYDPNLLTDKVLINSYFENNGNVDLATVESKCPLLFEKKETCDCDIDNILASYNITYIVAPVSKSAEFNDLLAKKYQIIYQENDIQILKVRENFYDKL